MAGMSRTQSPLVAVKNLSVMSTATMPWLSSSGAPEVSGSASSPIDNLEISDMRPKSVHTDMLQK